MERSRRLLLVEDEAVLRFLVAQFLEAAGYEVISAADGREAIALYDEAGPFLAALVDLNLPEVCGVDVCRHIRAVCPDQPILICSASVLPDNRAALEGLGIHHYLTKPFLPTMLQQRLAEVTGHPSQPSPPRPKLRSLSLPGAGLKAQASRGSPGSAV